MDNTILPNQRVSYNEKRKIDWYKPTYEYWIGRANALKETSKTEDNSTNYTNCKFEVVSNEDSINGLLQDVKNRSPLRKF